MRECDRDDANANKAVSDAIIYLPTLYKDLHVL